MTLYETIDFLKKIALKHPNIGSASEGNIYEYMNANPSVKYGVFFITQGTHSQDEMFNHFEFTLFYVDRLVDDMEENRLQIQSIGKEILSNILTFFCEEFDAECENISFQPFTQRFVDETAGIYSTITIDVPKDVICPEEYWKEDWVAPVTVIRNQDKRVVFTENGTYTIDYDPTTYTGLGNVEVDVNIDVDSYYNNGYNQGKTDGVNEQKSKLETINITENGTYSKEDGYNEIVVDVPDLNGSYDEGHQDGYNQGHTEGVEEGYNNGYEQGQADISAKARILNVTENGNYLSKFSDPIVPEIVTGVYADGTKFYSYAELNGKVFNTGIKVSENTKIEIWYKPRNLGFVTYGGIIGPIEDTSDNAFNIHTYIGDGFNNSPIGNVFNGRIKFYNSYYKPNDLNKWFHLELSFADGFVVDGVVVGTYTTNTSNYGRDIYINKYTETADGYYGMIKIDNTIIIPTKEGFLNTSTGELLEVVENGSYVYTNNEIIQGEGELYKTVNVNVLPKINIQKAGLKFGQSTFTEVPEWADFEGITDMENMFYLCSNLQTIPFIDTSNVTSMRSAFAYCRNLKILPNNLNLGNCTNMESLFEGVTITDYTFLMPWIINPNAEMGNMITDDNVDYVPAIPCVGNTGYYQSAIFWTYGGFNRLTYFGGWIGRKYNVTQDNILKMMPNLTYESCISILNNLYDFTGNGETPDGNQGKLKVAQSFIDKLTEEDLQIAVRKGWSILV